MNDTGGFYGENACLLPNFRTFLHFSIYSPKYQKDNNSLAVWQSGELARSPDPGPPSFCD
jgi:hypothetical protein